MSLSSDHRFVQISVNSFIECNIHTIKTTCCHCIIEWILLIYQVPFHNFNKISGHFCYSGKIPSGLLTNNSGVSLCDAHPMVSYLICPVDLPWRKGSHRVMTQHSLLRLGALSRMFCGSSMSHWIPSRVLLIDKECFHSLGHVAYYVSTYQLMDRLMYSVHLLTSYFFECTVFFNNTERLG